MESKIKLAIADDELLFREGLISILSKEKDIDILFDAEDGTDLLNQLKSSNTLPDIILIDLKMPNLNGVEATKLIIKEFPNIKIIALTSYFRKPFIINMISLGTVAYLAKNSTPKLMTTTIREVMRKGFYYDEKVLKFIHEGLINNDQKKIKSNFDNNYFTKRETQILKLICQQFTAIEIGETLFISPRTVEGHRNNLLLKTNSRNVAGLVVYAIQNGFINLDENL